MGKDQVGDRQAQQNLSSLEHAHQHTPLNQGEDHELGCAQKREQTEAGVQRLLVEGHADQADQPQPEDRVPEQRRNVRQRNPFAHRTANVIAASPTANARKVVREAMRGHRALAAAPGIQTCAIWRADMNESMTATSPPTITCCSAHSVGMTCERSSDNITVTTA